jgi:hypothetical protein
VVAVSPAGRTGRSGRSGRSRGGDPLPDQAAHEPPSSTTLDGDTHELIVGVPEGSGNRGAYAVEVTGQISGTTTDFPSGRSGSPSGPNPEDFVFGRLATGLLEGFGDAYTYTGEIKGLSVVVVNSPVTVWVDRQRVDHGAYPDVEANIRYPADCPEGYHYDETIPACVPDDPGGGDEPAPPGTGRRVREMLVTAANDPALRAGVVGGAGAVTGLFQS